MRSIWFTGAPLQYSDFVLAAVIAAVVGRRLRFGWLLYCGLMREGMCEGMCGVCAAAFWLHSGCVMEAPLQLTLQQAIFRQQEFGTMEMQVFCIPLSLWLFFLAVAVGGRRLRSGQRAERD